MDGSPSLRSRPPALKCRFFAQPFDHRNVWVPAFLVLVNPVVRCARENLVESRVGKLFPICHHRNAALLSVPEELSFRAITSQKNGSSTRRRPSAFLARTPPATGWCPKQRRLLVINPSSAPGEYLLPSEPVHRDQKHILGFVRANCRRRHVRRDHHQKCNQFRSKDKRHKFFAYCYRVSMTSETAEQGGILTAPKLSVLPKLLSRRLLRPAALLSTFPSVPQREQTGRNQRGGHKQDERDIQ